MTYYVEQETDQSSIQAAIEKASPGDVIMIGPGRYYEKVHIHKDGLTLIGSGVGKTVLVYDDYAKKDYGDGRDYGTFRTASVLVEGDQVTLEEMTIENSAGSGDLVGQALALYIDGHEVIVSECQLLGHQDTLFVAPLPKAPRIPNSFIGPSEGKTYRPQDAYFYETSIKGDIDFVFGSGRVVFHGCRFVSNNKHQRLNGYVFAPSTRQGETYGFVCLACDFTGEEAIGQGTVYLARPWRPYGKVHLLNCVVGRHIHPELMDDWSNKDNRATTEFTLETCVFQDFQPQVDPNFVGIGSQQEKPLVDLLSPWHQTMLKGNGGDIGV